MVVDPQNCFQISVAMKLKVFSTGEMDSCFKSELTYNRKHSVYTNVRLIQSIALKGMKHVQTLRSAQPLVWKSIYSNQEFLFYFIKTINTNIGTVIEGGR